MNKELDKFFTKVETAAKEHGIPDYAVMGVDIESTSFHEFSIGNDGLDNSNRTRWLTFVGLLRDAEHSLLTNPVVE